MANSYSRLLYHLVFSTKERRPLIESVWEDRLYAYLGGVVRDSGGVLLKIGGMADHLHLVLSHRPTVALSDVIRDIKAGSSRWIHENIERASDFGWQDGYGLFTVGPSHLDQVSNYVANQKEHHKTVSFEDELRALLVRAGVTFDERYLLD